MISEVSKGKLVHAEYKHGATEIKVKTYDSEYLSKEELIAVINNNSFKHTTEFIHILDNIDKYPNFLSEYKNEEDFIEYVNTKLKERAGKSK
jgi:hypothetical protein